MPYHHGLLNQPVYGPDLYEPPDFSFRHSRTGHILDDIRHVVPQAVDDPLDTPRGLLDTGVSPDMAQDVTRVTPQLALRPSIDFDAMERLGIRPPVPSSLLASLQSSASRWDPTGQPLAETTPQVMAPPLPMAADVAAMSGGPQQVEGLGAYRTRSALGGQPSIGPDEQSPLARSLAEAAGREDIEALEKFRGKTPIGQDVSRLAAGVAMTPFAGAPFRAFGVDPEQQQRIDAS